MTPRRRDEGTAWGAERFARGTAGAHASEARRPTTRSAEESLGAAERLAAQGDVEATTTRKRAGGGSAGVAETRVRGAAMRLRQLDARRGSRERARLSEAPDIAEGRAQGGEEGALEAEAPSTGVLPELMRAGRHEAGPVVAEAPLPEHRGVARIKAARRRARDETWEAIEALR